MIKLENKKNRFKGNVYVLTSKETYSSAADFAQAIKAYKLGKIIGEKTGGWIVCYGDIVEDQLPNSK
ncbi:MAG TPA: peptidase S41, partial [Candidatus Portnoybacteria bacterium]|nr:peptidase S41 [Candidatus Portnoybacteria bacterium]